MGAGEWAWGRGGASADALLQAALAAKEELDAVLMRWREEEKRMTQMVAAVTSAREQRAREARRATLAEKETQDAIQLRHLTIMDLTKRNQEVAARLKEFFALYEVVKVRWGPGAGWSGRG